MISFFTRHPTAANLAMALFLFIGAMTLPKLNRETFPDFRPSEVEVRVVYPGATPEDIEFAICQRIEDATDGIVGVEEVRSEALDNSARVVIKMKEDGDFQQFTSEVRAEVEAIDDFPELAEDPVIRQLGKKDRVLSVAVTGPMSAPDLKAYCEDLKARMLRDDNISIVDIEGFSQHQILIEIPSLQAAKFGLSVQQIARAISSQSFDQPTGQLKTTEKDIVLRFTEERRTIAEIEDLIIVASSDGAELRLGDVAKVTDVFQASEDKIEVNSVRAGMLRIKKTKDQDCLEVNDAVRAFFAEEDKIKLAGVEFTMTEDLTSIVRDRLQMLIVNGLEGLLLVFVVMWLFFGLKFSFWVSMGLPVAFMGSFYFLPIFGATINMLSMVALLLALGLLMDDAIVIAENVATRFQNGDSPVEAAANGTRQVSIGVFSSFVTTLGVFLPLAFLEGNIGKVLKVVPVVLILVLAVSLVEAFLILPNHLSHSLNRTPPSPFRRRFDAFIEWVRESIVGKVVDWTTRWRYLVLGMVMAVFVLSVSMLAGGIVKFQGFPDIEGDVVVCRVLLPQGTPIERTEETVRTLVSTLEEINQELSPNQPDGQKLILNKVVQFNINTDAQERGAHVATISADLLSSEIRKTTIDTLLTKWREKIGVLPDVIQLKFAEPNFGPAGRPIDIRLQGDDFKSLKNASHDLQEYLSSYTGVLDLSDDLRPGKPQERFKLAAGAKSLGVDARMIAEQLRAAYQGLTARQIQVQTENYDIEVRTADSDRDSFADLDNFQVTLASGQHVPLSQLVVQTSDRGWARIHRINGRRTITVQGDVNTTTSNTAEIITALKREFLPDLKKRYPNTAIVFEGEMKESEITGKSMLRGLIVGLFGCFIILSLQFRSFIEPIIVMVAIPLSLIGVIGGHWLMGLPLTMPSMLGFVSLAGVVVNDSILLVEFIKLRRREGLSVEQSALRASRERFRAVLLTSVTTIVGLIPLLSETSTQAQILIPLAASIVFGLMASTVLVLFVIPVFYTILDDLGLTATVDDESH